jgi:hypothetical protein
MGNATSGNLVGGMGMRLLPALALLSASLASTAARAQESFELKGSGGWINSKEMSLDRLKGKVVVLYFFSDQ